MSRVIVLLDPRLGTERDAAELAAVIREVRKQRAEEPS